MKRIIRVTLILITSLLINILIPITSSLVFLNCNYVYASETFNNVKEKFLTYEQSQSYEITNLDNESNKINLDNKESTANESGNKYKFNKNNNEKENEIDVNDIDGTAKEEINSLYDYIKKMKTEEELMNNIDPVEYIKQYIKDGKGNLSFHNILNGVLSLVFKEVRSVLKLSLSIVTIAIICSLLKNLQDAFSEESISEVAFYACYALIIILLSKSFIISISVAKEVIANISDFMSALLPILITMISLSGGITSAATLDPIVLGAVVFIPKIYSNIIIPMILMIFVLEFANNISTEHKITNLCKLFKQVTIWFQGIIVTIFIGLLTIRGITSTTMDAVTLKTTKFAVDNFIPIVGKAFSDAITSVAGYSLIIKNAISSIGLVIVILILLHPLIKLILMAFIYKLSAALVEPISDSRITKSIEAAGSSMVLIISCVLTVSLMFFVLIGIMASTGRFIVGG